MTAASLLLQDFDTQISNTRRTLERVPEGNNDWVPHPRSMKLGKLAMHCATLPIFGYHVLEDDGMDMAAPKRPHVPLVFESREAVLQTLDDAASMCRAALVAASDEHLAQTWPFSFGDQLITNNPRSISYRQLFFNHLIHHVAQLGVYLRLQDIPVPGLYGPSADEPWSPPGK